MATMARLRDLKPRIAGLFAYKADPGKGDAFRAAAARLSQEGWKVLAVPVLRGAVKGLAQIVPAAALARRSGLLVSLGGDGTLLGAAHLAAPLGKPVLGINLGGLGFMTAVAPERMDAQLGSLLRGACRIEDRAMVRVQVLRKGQRPRALDALNDVSVLRVQAGRLVRMEASVDGRFLASFRADGLVFSTPTGSTAYSMSLGGPVIDPRAPLQLLTLVAPHTLSSRPLALRESSVLEVVLPDTGLELSADGKHHLRLKAGDHLRFQRSPYQASLVLAPNHDPWSVLRNKLGWQGHARGMGSHRA